MLPFFVARHKTPAEDKKKPAHASVHRRASLYYLLAALLGEGLGVRLLNKNLLAIHDVDTLLLLGEALACNVVDDLVACLALN